LPAHASAGAHTHKRAHTHTLAHTHAHTHIHIRIHIHIYTTFLACRYLYDRLSAARRFCLDMATKKATQPTNKGGGLVGDEQKPQESPSEVGVALAGCRSCCLVH